MALQPFYKSDLPQIDVRDFGARGNGVADDTAAVQAAVNAAACGRPVHFPAGTYVLRNVLVPANTTIQGDGNAVLKLKAMSLSTDKDPILNVRGPYVTVRGLTFDGNRSNQTGGGFSDNFYNAGTGYGRAYRCAILGNTDVNTGGIAGIHNVRVEGCRFTEVYGAGIATWKVDYVYVLNNTLDNSNFEMALLYGDNATRNPDNEGAFVHGNFLVDLDSGEDGNLPNGNGFFINGYNLVSFFNNTFRRVARDGFK